MTDRTHGLSPVGRALAIVAVVSGVAAALAFGATRTKAPTSVMAADGPSAPGVLYTLSCRHALGDALTVRGRVDKEAKLPALQQELEEKGVLTGGETCVVSAERPGQRPAGG